MNTGEVGARALRYWELRQTAASNNLANVSTPGFKAERVFAELLDGATVRAASGTDFGAGAVNQTGRPLDVALVGDGWLVVETPSGNRWTRGGSLSLDQTGTLVDSGGRPVLGDGGPIVLPPGEVRIGESGAVSVDGYEVGRLRIERATEGGPGVREGASLWVPADSAMQVGQGEVRVLQGNLEDSNVDAVGAMVEMIEIQRAYSAVQGSMRSVDEAMQTITSEIGRVG